MELQGTSGVGAGQSLLNATCSGVWSKAFKAIAVWVHASDKAWGRTDILKVQAVVNPSVEIGMFSGQVANRWREIRCCQAAGYAALNTLRWPCTQVGLSLWTATYMQTLMDDYLSLPCLIFIKSHPFCPSVWSSCPRASLLTTQPLTYQTDYWLSTVKILLLHSRYLHIFIVMFLIVAIRCIYSTWLK